MRASIVRAIPLLLAASTAWAQLSDVQPGSRIKFSAPSVSATPVTGTVTSRSADALRVTDDDGASILCPIADVALLDRSTGRSRWAGARTGVVLGAATGFFFGLAMPNPSCDTRECRTSSDVRWRTGTTLAGATMGMILGAINGRETWSKVAVPSRVSVAPIAGGVGVRVGLGH
ncbi:MAG: hypothetical protein HY084_03340 [Gemmatimonadetes bacterium]|nr:hypothetical protein [Gemmatimonadota bacterium]